MKRYIAELVILDDDGALIGFETSSSFAAENIQEAIIKLYDGNPNCRIIRLYEEVNIYK